MGEFCAEHVAHQRDLNRHEAQIASLNSSVQDLKELQATLTEIQKQNAETLKRMDERVSELEAKPSHRWDTVETVLLTAILTAIVTYLIAVVLGG